MLDWTCIIITCVVLWCSTTVSEMATGKAELPTLAGKRVKTRKRDEKVKYDPKEFSEQLISSLNEAKSLEEISKYLDKAGSEMDYR